MVIAQCKKYTACTEPLCLFEKVIGVNKKVYRLFPHPKLEQGVPCIEVVLTILIVELCGLNQRLDGLLVVVYLTVGESEEVVERRILGALKRILKVLYCLLVAAFIKERYTAVEEVLGILV